MRSAIVLLLVPLLLAAGCSAPKDDEAGDPTPTPAATTPIAPSPTPDPAPASPTPTPPTSPSPPSSSSGRPYSGFWSHSHSEAPRVETFVVPEGAADTGAVITFMPANTGTSLQCQAPNVRVELADPFGVVLRAGPPAACGVAAREDKLPMRAGTWTLWFNGTGEVTSALVMGSGNSSSSSSTNGNATEVPFSRTEEHDFRNAEETIPFDVPANAAPVQIRMAFEPADGAPACIVATEIAIELLRPDGTLHARHAMSGGGIATDACGGEKVEGNVRLAAGKWNVRFTGTGAAVGLLAISPA